MITLGNERVKIIFLQASCLGLSSLFIEFALVYGTAQSERQMKDVQLQVSIQLINVANREWQLGREKVAVLGGMVVRHTRKVAYSGLLFSKPQEFRTFMSKIDP